MNSPVPGTARPRGGRAVKRDAIMSAARLVFGRDGYARTSIDAIAKEAGVSTRTIYNHFVGKEELFGVVLEASASRVADTYLEAVRTGLPVGAGSPAQRLAAELRVIGRALLRQGLDHPEHFAMIRQITAEAGHFPRPVLLAWREAGPLRVRRDVADRLRGYAERGLLRADDPYRAAGHLVALVSAELGQQYLPWADQLTEPEVDEALAAAVRAFLHGYVSDLTHPASVGPD